MDFSTGNSGNILLESVTKLGPECQQEGAYCQLLGDSIAPKIYAIIPGGYVMEALTRAERFPTMAILIEKRLLSEVWCRSALPVSNDTDWRDKLKVYGITVPDWAIPTESCMVHGDPTFSNCLYRFSGELPQLVLADPRPPRDYIPQCRETDMGRILQSIYGWETAAYGAPEMTFYDPDFMHDDFYRKRATFWCGAAAARIEYLERSRNNRPNILEWCRKVRSLCGV